MTRVFVFTYNRYDSISTSAMLEKDGVDHTVLCHTEEARQHFIDGGLVLPERITATGEGKGLANNRNAALEMMEDGEWALFLVDDLKKVTELDSYDTMLEDQLNVDMKNQREWRARLNTEVTMQQFLKRGEEAARHVERLGGALAGFAGINNPLFRNKKYTYNVLADGRAWMVKKTHLRFDLNAQLIDDLCWTALNIKEFGVVAVNQWVLPDCKRYTSGSYGSIQERLPQKKKEAKYLVDTYPNLIRYKDKTGWPPRSHVVLRPQRIAKSQG